jgi:hypothetical protein
MRRTDVTGPMGWDIAVTRDGLVWVRPPALSRYTLSPEGADAVARALTLAAESARRIREPSAPGGPGTPGSRR